MPARADVEQQALTTYSELRKTIIALTGHEQDVHKRSDEERYTAHQILARELNTTLQLGMDDIDQRLLALNNTSLSYANRFADDPNIDPAKGESPVKHSAHAAADYMLACYQGICASQDPAVRDPNNPDLITFIREGALGCLWHDGDEVFGEPTTVQSRSVSNTNEQDAGEGLRVLHYALTLAMHAIEAQDKLDSDEPIHDYFKTCATIRELGDVKSKGFNNILAYIKAHPAPEISEDGKARVARALRHFAVAEKTIPQWHSLTGQPAEVPATPSAQDRFIGESIKACERREGNGHYRRYMVEGGVVRMADHITDTPIIQKRIRTRDGIIPHRALSSAQRSEAFLLSHVSVPVNSVTALKNITYMDGNIGAVLSAATTPLEQALASQFARNICERICELAAAGPHYVDRFPESRENYADLREQAKYRLSPSVFLAQQRELQRQYYAQDRGTARHTHGKSERYILPEIATRQEVIAAYQQQAKLIAEGKGNLMWVTNPDGSSVYEGLGKRRAPLPDGFNLNLPVQRSTARI